MIARNRPVRVAAAVGATLAAGAVTMLAATSSASADEPGHCVQNVNIREEPDADSRIVALCEAGSQVQLGAERDGFVRIDDLGGWASKEYVKADESASSSDDRSADEHHSSSDRDDDGDEHHSSSDGGHSHGSGSDASGGDESGESGEAGDAATGAGGSGGLGGLLG